MNRLLAALLGRTPKSDSGVRRADGRRVRPRLEALEDRRVLALVGPAFLVSTPEPDNPKDQMESAVASSSNGMTVAVWTHESSSTNGDIRAQLYHANGTPKKSIVVAGGTNDDSDPSVAMDGQGNFVVTWTRLVGGQWDIRARRYSSAGDPLGAAFKVTTSGLDEFDSDVAMDADGDFVVSYTQNGSSNDVRAARYNRFGTFQNDIPVAALGHVQENESSIAMAPDGRFVVGYTSMVTGSNNANVFLDRFDKFGVRVDSDPIATTNDYEQDPGVAMDSGGNAVVAFQTFTSGGDVNIRARRVSSSGSVGALMFIASQTGGTHELDPEVGMSNSGTSTNTSNFVVTYSFYGPVDNFTSHVGLAEVVGNQVKDINLGPAPRSQSAISMNGSGAYFLTYTSHLGELDIRGRRGQL